MKERSADSSSLAVVVLAAGAGTRMRSEVPKVLHRAAGRSMLAHVLRVAGELAQKVVVVTGHGAEQVEAHFSQAAVHFVRQHEQQGTAHAFLAAREALRGWAGEILVLYGDTPLLLAETLREAIRVHRDAGAGMTIVSAQLDEPTGYGRIIRDEAGEVVRIVEEKAATAEEKRIKETNSGVYVFSSEAFKFAESIELNPFAREYYLTDILEMYKRAGERVVAFCAPSSTEFMGVNDRVQLAFAESVLRGRIRDRLLRSGVSMIDPATVYIDDTVEIGQDTIIYPFVFLEGQTIIGQHCLIGPNSRLCDTVLAAGVEIHGWSVLEGARVGAGSSIGPFARLRSGSELAEEVHVGNFVEVKNAQLGVGVKAGHLAYIGDAELGAQTNFSAGAITANYDGVEKHRTVIGEAAFVGTNVTLIAPVKLERAAFVAAGSTVTGHIPEGALAVARGEMRILPDWAKRYWMKAIKRGSTKFHASSLLKPWLESMGTS